MEEFVKDYSIEPAKEHIDENGKWVQLGSIKILVEPSEEWKAKNQPEIIPVKSKEQITKEALKTAKSTDEKLNIIINYLGLG